MKTIIDGEEYYNSEIEDALCPVGKIMYGDKDGCCIAVSAPGIPEYRQCANHAHLDMGSGLNMCTTHQNNREMYYSKIKYCDLCGKVLPERITCYEWIDKNKKYSGYYKKWFEGWEHSLCFSCVAEGYGECKICGQIKKVRRIGSNAHSYKGREKRFAFKGCKVCKDVWWYGVEKNKKIKVKSDMTWEEKAALYLSAYIVSGYNKQKKERKHAKEKRDNKR